MFEMGRSWSVWVVGASLTRDKVGDEAADEPEGRTSEGTREEGARDTNRAMEKEGVLRKPMAKAVLRTHMKVRMQSGDAAGVLTLRARSGRRGPPLGIDRWQQRA